MINCQKYIIFICEIAAYIFHRQEETQRSENEHDARC